MADVRPNVSGIYHGVLRVQANNAPPPLDDVVRQLHTVFSKLRSAEKIHKDLNADLLDGYHASDFVRQTGSGGTGYMTNDNIPVGTERDLQFPNVDGTAPAFTTYPTTGSMPVKTSGTAGGVVEGAINLASADGEVTGVLEYPNGGTGLSTLGTGLQVLRTNAGATAMEWATPTTGTVTDVTATAPIASTGGATPNISHNTSGVTAGDYISPNITVDNKGHITAASSGGTGDYGSTGILTGGALSIGTGGAGVATTFTIATGTGKVVDPTTNPPTVTAVSWSAKTDVAVTNIGTQLVTFVAIDSAGNVQQSGTLWTPAQNRDYIAIGVVVHSNLTTVNAVNQGQGPLQSLGNQFVDLSLSLGTFNITGNVFSANGANLKLNKSAGSVFRQGANYTSLTDNPHVVTLASLTQASLRMQNQTGAGSASTTDIDPNNYDVGGVTTAVPANKFSILRIFSFVSNLVAVQRGQAVYNSLAEAKAAIQTEPYVTNDILAANGILRGFLVVRQGTTDLTDATDAFFIESGRFGGSAGVGGLSVSTLQNAYDNSSDPEITTDTTRGAVTIKRGSAADTDTVLEGQNGAGSTTFSVTGAGVVTIPYEGLRVLDSDLSHYHQLRFPDNLSANRILNIDVNDADRTVSLSGNLTVSAAATVSGTNTGDQTISLTGDVSGSGTGSFATTIANDAVTTAKIIDDAVTYAKMQNVSATDRLLGRSTAGAGVVEEITCTSFARSILDDVDATAVRTTIGAGTGTIIGSTGGTDNRVLRCDGAGTVTLQNSAVEIDDTGNAIPATDSVQSLGSSSIWWLTGWIDKVNQRDPDAWSASTVKYYAGNVVYYDHGVTGKEYYVCIAENTSSATNGPVVGSTGPASWRRLENMNRYYYWEPGSAESPTILNYASGTQFNLNNVSGGDVVLTLPTTAGTNVRAGDHWTFRASSVGGFTIDIGGVITLDADGEAVTVKFDGTEWYVESGYGVG